MFPGRCPSRFTISSIALLIFISFCISAVVSGSLSNEAEDDFDLEGLEELLAIDESEEEESQKAKAGHERSSGPGVLRKAQEVVLELSNENVKRTIDGNEFVLLLGYAPWCHRSADLMPEFAEAAVALKEMGSSIVLAKLDAERHSKAASMLGIKGFPTLLLFVNGSAESYSGGLSGEEIVIWARKRSGVPLIRLSTTTEAEKFLKKYRIFTIGLFEKFEGHDYEEFVKAATADNEIQFVETNNIEVAGVLFPDVKPKEHFLALVKSEPERYETFGDSFEEAKILQFLSYNKFPLVTVLTELNSIKVHSSPIKIQVYVFAEVDDYDTTLPLLQDVARKFKSKILFIYVDTVNENLAKPFLSLFGIESEQPIVAAFDNSIGSKFLLESDLTPSNLEEFCLELVRGTLTPYYKSEKIPYNSGIVQAVVGKTFDSLVLNNKKNVLLEVYTPWCLKCEDVSKQIEQLAKHFEEVDSILFARIDASSNEHPRLQVNEYPTLLFYPSRDKHNPTKVSKKPSLKQLIAFVNAMVKADEDRGISAPDQTTKDEL